LEAAKRDLNTRLTRSQEDNDNQRHTHAQEIDRLTAENQELSTQLEVQKIVNQTLADANTSLKAHREAAGDLIGSAKVQNQTRLGAQALQLQQKFALELSQLQSENSARLAEKQAALDKALHENRRLEVATYELNEKVSGAEVQNAELRRRLEDKNAERKDANERHDREIRQMLEETRDGLQSELQAQYQRELHAVTQRSNAEKESSSQALAELQAQLQALTDANAVLQARLQAQHQTYAQSLDAKNAEYQKALQAQSEELNRQAQQAYQGKVNEFNSQLQAQNTALAQQQVDSQAHGQAQLAALQARFDELQQQAQVLLARKQTLENQKQASDAKIAEYEAQRLTTQSQQSLPPDAASPPFALLQSPGKGLPPSIAIAQSRINELEKQNR
jgi:myosin heavy subunit